MISNLNQNISIGQDQVLIQEAITIAYLSFPHSFLPIQVNLLYNLIYQLISSYPKILQDSLDHGINNNNYEFLSLSFLFLQFFHQYQLLIFNLFHLIYYHPFINLIRSNFFSLIFQLLLLFQRILSSFYQSMANDFQYSIK